MARGAPKPAEVGRFLPSHVETVSFDRIEQRLLDQLRGVSGVSSMASDALDAFGFSLAVGEGILVPRTPLVAPVVGHVITLRYLPERRRYDRARDEDPQTGFSQLIALDHTQPGDVLVIDASQVRGSVMGGVAAVQARTAGLAGCIIDGAVRDVDELIEAGLPVLSRTVTPVTGKWRLAAVGLNLPAACGGVHVRPGDLVVADGTGICFLPPEVAAQVIEHVLEHAAGERATRVDDPKVR